MMNFFDHIQETLQMVAVNFSHNVVGLEEFFRMHYSPLYLLLSVLALMLLLGLLRVQRQQRVVAKAFKPTPAAEFLTNKQVDVIAGENPIATKLDLARAYIEMGKKNLAKSILLNVQKQGTDLQKQQAKKLFETL